MSRFFSRYGVPSYAEDEHRPFSHYFRKHAAPRFLAMLSTMILT